jgi:hypothetical protein
MLGIATAGACDLCSIYAAGQARGEIGTGLFGALSGQFTHFGTLQQDGEEVPNPMRQFLDSTILQALVGYNFTERLGVQFNAPLIYRQFRRPVAGSVEEGSVSGLGDVSLLATYEALRFEKKHSTFAWSLLAGVKFPTGSTSRLREETVETQDATASGIHGHDLTLGSGSYDGIVGTSLYGRRGRVFVAGSVQYAIRSAGSYDYRFANDLVWSAAPGLLVLLTDNYTLSIEANVSGETKGWDQFRGAPAEDTAITAVYLGPQVVFTWRDKLSAQLGLDFPVLLDNTSLQIVPDYRIRAGLTWHF